MYTVLSVYEGTSSLFTSFLNECKRIKLNRHIAPHIATSDAECSRRRPNVCPHRQEYILPWAPRSPYNTGYKIEIKQFHIYLFMYEGNLSRAKLWICTGPIAFILRWISEKLNSSLTITHHFYMVYVHYFWKFTVKHFKYTSKKSAWLLGWTAVSTTWRQSDVMSTNHLFQLSVTSLTFNVSWPIIHPCMKLVGPKWSI